MAKQAFAQDVEFEPIDRLEEKVTLLVTMVARLRADQAKAADENARLTAEVASLQTELADARQASGEVTTLREERDVIRGRVSEMLQQLEQIAL
jgi:regulator of replication initiation timing